MPHIARHIAASRIKPLFAALMTSAALLSMPSLVQAQTISEQTEAGTSRPLNLAPDSPYRDPDIIYLEADELINNDENGILTARGEVEGRYQDRTLRADEVVYTLSTGQVIATGNVVLIDANGSAQFAEKLELSDELEAGTASGFTSRMPGGGIMGAAFATRRTDQGVELYNAYYTACEACSGSKPTWQIKARRVSQDKDRNMIRYRDAVFEFMGVPFFYTPYLSHPDPTAGRASGWLSPFFGLSNSKGFNVEAPYYLALDPYSEMTLTPRVFQKVNPIMEYAYRRKFYSGEVNVEGSFTYSSFFNRDGDPFTTANTFSDPTQAPLGKRVRSHMFANGLFEVSKNWDWGFGVQGTTDDLYLNRYDLEENPAKFGLYEGDGQRLVSQIFGVGQDDDFRVTASAYGFQSLRTAIREDVNDPNNFFISREDDSVLPVIAPKIELTKYFTDPVLSGRLKAASDVTVLTRKLGTDYTRATASLDWNKTFIVPGGIEAKPFGEVRYDYFDINPEDAPQADFSRSLGQVGLDVRWPFINAGKNVSIIVEPRALITQNFGDGKIANFTAVDSNNQNVSLFQDSIDIDLDQALFWADNKSTGYDFWQEGFRADVGGAVSALWGNSRTSLFLGQSFASDYTDSFGQTTGISGDNSDLIGLFELDLDGRLVLTSRVRYDDDTSKFRRIDTGFSYYGKRLSTNWRYYKIDAATLSQASDPTIPAEEISGGFTLKLTDRWSTRYTAYHDIGRDITRRQEMALIFGDCCTRIEFVYDESNFDSDVIRDSQGFGIRLSLATLGDFGEE